MKKVTCQMQCTEIVTYENSEQRDVHLSAVIDAEGAWEDFTKYTPDGSCNLMIDGSTTQAAEFFEEGGVYKMTFEKAEPIDV